MSGQCAQYVISDQHDDDVDDRKEVYLIFLSLYTCLYFNRFNLREKKNKQTAKQAVSRYSMYPVHHFRS